MIYFVAVPPSQNLHNELRPHDSKLTQCFFSNPSVPSDPTMIASIEMAR